MDLLIGDPSRAKQKLNWQPSVNFEELIHPMMDVDLRALGLVPMNGNTHQNVLERATLRISGEGSVAIK